MRRVPPSIPQGERKNDPKTVRPPVHGEVSNHEQEGYPLGFCEFNVLYTTKRKAASSNSQNSLQEKTRGEARKEGAKPLLERLEADIVRRDLK